MIGWVLLSNLFNPSNIIVNFASIASMYLLYDFSVYLSLLKEEKELEIKLREKKAIDEERERLKEIKSLKVKEEERLRDEMITKFSEQEDIPIENVVEFLEIFADPKKSEFIRFASDYHALKAFFRSLNDETISLLRDDDSVFIKVFQENKDVEKITRLLLSYGFVPNPQDVYDYNNDEMLVRFIKDKNKMDEFYRIYIEDLSAFPRKYNRLSNVLGSKKISSVGEASKKMQRIIDEYHNNGYIKYLYNLFGVNNIILEGYKEEYPLL